MDGGGVVRSSCGGEGIGIGDCWGEGIGRGFCDLHLESITYNELPCFILCEGYILSLY